MESRRSAKDIANPDFLLTGPPPHAFLRLDETPDAEFCARPRFVAHIDAAAITVVTRLCREYFPTGGEALWNVATRRVPVLAAASS